MGSVAEDDAQQEAEVHRPPDTVGGGRYRVTGTLGEGARKWVYRAVDTRLDRPVAVAVVKTATLDDESRRRMDREARAMARLGDHPLIVTVHDVGDDEGRPYIVSQLMPGGSVAELLDAADGRRLPFDRVLAIGEQLASALAHAHAHDVVHRDLKPANVWLTAAGTAQLGDFGLAVPIDQSRLTDEGLVVGTVAYLAPEQALGQVPDGRADLYSLGALLYECICGRPPFLGDDAVGVISQHLNTPPLAPSWHRKDVPRPLEDLVVALLAKRAEDRPASAEEVAAELRRIGDGLHQAGDVAPDDDDDDADRALPAIGRVVGRVPELGQLRASLDQALSGRPRLTLVAGEPGIGKTRLVEELAVYAGLRRVQVLWGRCFEGEGGVPYLPFVEAFRGYARRHSDEELREVLGTSAPELSTLVSEIRTRFAELTELPPLDPDAERLRLFDGVACFVRNASLRSPLLIVLDDLHWADKPSLLLLQYLIRHLDRDRVMIVGTYRDVELDRTHPLADTIASLRRERMYERVLLRGLSLDDVGDLLVAASNQEPPREFVEVIHRETEGNPFFISEILRHLVDTGALRREGDQWVGTPDAVIENLPEGVREVIGRRLSRLTDECNALLTVAAAMPQGFTLDVVSDVAGLDDEQALDLLDEALRHHVVQERRDTTRTLEFSHALIRQTLYGELSTPRRVRLHRQIADALERHYGSTADAHLSELAFHSFQAAPAGDADRAISYCTRAAQRASGQAAFEEAQRFCDMAIQALELTEEPDPRRRFDLLLELGTNAMHAGEGERARAAFREAADVGRSLDDAMLLSRAAVARSGIGGSGGIADPEVTGLLRDALDRVGDQDMAMRATVLERLAIAYAFVDDRASQEYAREALKASEAAADPRARLRALFAWTLTLTRPEHKVDSDAAAAEMRRLAKEVDDVDLVLSAITYQVAKSLMDQDRSVFDQSVDDSAVLAERSRSLSHRLAAVGYAACRATIDGRYEQLDAIIPEMLEMARRMGDRNQLNIVGITVYPSIRERGQLELLEGPTRRIVERSPEVGWRTGLAHLLAVQGELDEAAEHLDAIGAIGWERIPENVARQYAWASGTEASAIVGARDHAAALYELLLPRANRAVLLGPSAYYGSTERYLGLAAGVMREHGRAVAHLEAAEAAHVRFRSPPWVARTRYDLARALVARDGEGDRRRALALLNAALDTARSLGMTRLTEEVMAEKLTLQGVTSSGTHSIDVIASLVSIERPDLSDHAGDDGRVTVMFSDIEGSTELTEQLGDAAMHRVLHRHNEVIRRAVAGHGGTEVKSQGDGFMLTFADPLSAARCALDIQQQMVDDVRVRIGLHTGEVIREGGDFFGRTVILAARVADAAAGGEILVSDELRQRLEATNRFQFDPPRMVTLKGLAGEHAVSRLTE